MSERMTDEEWDTLKAVLGDWKHARIQREAQRAREAEASLTKERDEALAKVAERSMVAEFHRAMDVPVLDKPTDPGVEVRRRRARLVLEEAVELVVALGFAVHAGPAARPRLGELHLVDTHCHVALDKVAKEAADLRYVMLGTELELGLPGDEVFRAVHESNMTKLGPDWKPVRREDGKVMKGPNYRPPDVEAIIRKHTAGEDQQKEST